MSILIENISKNFERLSGINLEIPTGKIVALIGPSGSGKSTLLRTIAGFEKPDSGRIWLQGQNSTYLPINQRKIGFVFQDYALFPKLNVYENIIFGLKIQKKPPSYIQIQLNKFIELTQLENFTSFYPYQLSGGQKQRVEFARALIIEPKILLLDEPFSALDFKIRQSLKLWLKNLHKDFSVTSLLVTHDLKDAAEIANEIVILKKGYIEQIGTAEEIYEYPATKFVQNFINC